MSNLSGYFAVFKTGVLEDSRGKKHTITTADLDNIARQYNEHGEGWKEAPAVLGHPLDDSPAYAWLNDLKRKGNLLFARVKDVVPGFAQAIKDKMYKYVSLSVLPGGKVKHLGFLGGRRPAVSGLGAVTPAFAHFDEGEECDTFTFNFAELNPDKVGWKFSTLGRLLRNLREHFIAEDSIETADRLVPEFVIEEMEQPAYESSASHVSDSFSEGDPPTPPGVDEGMQESGEHPEPAAGIPEDKMQNKGNQMQKINQEKEADMPNQIPEKGKNTNAPPGAGGPAAGIETPAPGASVSTAEFAELQQKVGSQDEIIAGLLQEKDESQVTSFAEGLRDEGKIFPVELPVIKGILKNLSGTETYDFAEPGGEPSEVAPRKALMKFLGNLPQRVPLEEIKKGSRGPGSAGSDDDQEVYEFAESRELSVHEEGLDFAKKARALMAEKGIATFTEALSLVEEKGGN